LGQTTPGAKGIAFGEAFKELAKNIAGDDLEFAKLEGVGNRIIRSKWDSYEFWYNLANQKTMMGQIDCYVYVEGLSVPELESLMEALPPPNGWFVGIAGAGKPVLRYEVRAIQDIDHEIPTFDENVTPTLTLALEAMLALKRWLAGNPLQDLLDRPEKAIEHHLRAAVDLARKCGRTELADTILGILI
jgi:hypothetical protein